MGCGSSSAPLYEQHEDEAENVPNILATTLRQWKLPPAENPPQRDTVETDHMFCSSTRGELADFLRASPTLHSLVDDATTAAGTEAGARLRALGGALTHDRALANEVPVPLLPSVHTSTDVFITDVLGGVLDRLVRGEFNGHANGHSCIFIGPRGSGKTYALRRVALTASVRYASLRVVYVTAKHIADASHPLRDGLCSLLLKLDLQGPAVQCSAALASSSDSAAAARPNIGAASSASSSGGTAAAAAPSNGGASAAAPSSASVDALLRHLHSQRLHLLVVVDEMEALYETREAYAHRVVLELAALADINKGLTAVVGCSSSSLLYPLVQGGRNDRMPAPLRAAHFPLADVFTLADMNDQKMALRNIPAPPPVGGEDVAAFCKQGGGEHASRIVAFVLGSNARRLYKRKLPPLLYAPVPACSTAGTRSVPYATAFRDAHPLMLDLLAMIYDFLGAQNADLLKRVLRAVPRTASVLQTLNLPAIGSVNWLERFAPLASDTVWSLARVLQAENGFDEGEIHAMLDFLHYDAAVIVMQRGDAMDELTVYPSCVLAVVQHLRWRERQVFSITDVQRSARIAVRDGPQWLLQNASVANNWKSAGEQLGSLLKVVAGGVARATAGAALR